MIEFIKKNKFISIFSFISILYLIAYLYYEIVPTFNMSIWYIDFTINIFKTIGYLILFIFAVMFLAMASLY